ncbi:hypothetical protein [uncultured Brevundimonas sp.]|uniref:hypothetical protein n=1 Tax=uncultured Brevundimonas sp. TaxID=213418 RepID=UPI0025F69F21|nr:hypothetical protein [uncultured Brevundimonas sp.]
MAQGRAITMAMRNRFGCLALLALLVCAPLVGWQTYQYVWYQSVLPHGVEARWIEYRKQAAWGFGPGADEVGLIIYRLEKASLSKIEDGGLAYLSDASESQVLVNASQRKANERRTYWDWKRTPIVPLWSEHGEHNCGREPGIGAFLDRNDFRCKLDPKTVSRVNAIISSDNAFYAHGRGGSVVIVAPAEKRVILAYSG